MSRESFVLIAGAIIFFLPWIGIPDDWKRYAIAACGVMLFVVGYLLRRAAYLRRIDMGNAERGTDSFVESHLPAGLSDEVGSLPEQGEYEPL